MAFIQSALDKGPQLASLREQTSNKEQTRPGTGWKTEVPSDVEAKRLATSEAHVKARRRNLMKQMRLAQQRKKAADAASKGKVNLRLANTKKMLKAHSTAHTTQMFASKAGKRPASARIRRSISYPTIGTDDGRPPWRAAGEAFKNTELDRRKHDDSKKTLGARLEQDKHVDTGPATDETKEEDGSSADMIRSKSTGSLTQEDLAKLEKEAKIAAKKAAEKAKLPSYYSPIEKYHPPKKEYERRTRKYAHEFVVTSRTPGPKYDVPEKVLRGGVISTAKPKSTIEWIQYYASQIPSPAQYNPTDPMLAASPSTRMPDYRGKTELEEIIYRAKQTPGPADYALSQPKLRGGVISKAKSKTDVEWAIYRASSIPGPQDYPAPPLPRKGGGCFSNAIVPTSLDVIMRMASQTPSPAEYDTTALVLPKGGKLNRDTNTKSWLDLIAMRASETPGPSDNRPLRQRLPGGGRFSTAKPKDHVETLIYNKREIPGPGAYGNADLAPRQTPGARFNESRPLSDVDVLIKRSSEVPAPGDYNPRPQVASGVSQRFSTANPKTDTEWRIYHGKLYASMPLPPPPLPPSLSSCVL